MEILKYLFVIDILVAVSLVFALIWGLVHKTSTNLRHLIAILIPVILFFCLLNPISNKIVNKEITAEDYRSAISKLPEKEWIVPFTLYFFKVSMVSLVASLE